MLKLVLCVLCAFILALVMLQLRQQELELKHRAAALHNDIQGQQAKLWSQQLQIAVYTAPNAIANTIGKDLELVPEGNLPQEAANWLADRHDPDAE